MIASSTIYKPNTPTILVAFGATGNLMAKKIIPSLFHLYKKGELPNKFMVIGLGRRPKSEKEFQTHVRKMLTAHEDTAGEKKVKKFTPHHFSAKKSGAGFTQRFTYLQANAAERKDYTLLANKLREIDKKWGVCSSKLFYLSVPPGLYKAIFTNLSKSKLTEPCSDETGWTRVIVEKPFGKDRGTARELDTMLGEFFKENQVYRIDHYLAKEMLQNILSFRFSNNIFENSWSGENIERIDISLLESIGVEDRGPFYESVGALRDVGQNHLLQMLALVTMENPGRFEASAIRKKRTEALRALTTPKKTDVKNGTFRAQYNGYRSVKGVDPHSNIETYFRLHTTLDGPRWSGVKVSMESGKRMGKPRKEIVVTFKHPTPCLCPPERHFQNRVTFQLEPEEGISVEFQSKKPGLKREIEERNLDFLFRESSKRSQYTEEYEKLLLDCIAGDQTLFVGTSEVQEMWRFVDPIITGWNENIVPLESYKPDADRIVKRAKEALKEGAHKAPQEKGVGIIGLGKMGSGIARRLLENGWNVVGYNRTESKTKILEHEGLKGAYSMEEFVRKIKKPRVIWLMVPAGKAVDDMLFGKDGCALHLEKGDMVIDGGNSFFKDSVAREKKLQRRGIHFMDVGVSGGPGGARNGACLMVGGDKKIYQKLEPLFKDLAAHAAYGYFGKSGAGHFVKMVHNGIEYGMMQAIAEGFEIMKRSRFKPNLKNVADVYNHKSVVESRLVGWLKDGFEEYGEDLKKISSAVGHTGEGAWTVQTAKELGVPTPIITGALRFRKQSAQKPSYTGKVLSTLRNQFGGHSVT
jgi:glucose-6-phosphate 1-dehydrogenase